MSDGSSSIKHIVVLMMCSRSFDHMLGFAATPTWQIEGLTGREKNRDSSGKFAVVSNDANYSGDFTPDPGHALFDTLTQLYGDANTPTAQDPAMSGFVLSYEGKTRNSNNAHRIMKCFKPEKIPVLTQLARQFAVCDRWFSSVPGPTFPNRAFVHGSTSIGRVDMGVDWLGMSKTIYELLAENNVDSKIFYHDSTMAMTFQGLMNQGKYFALYDDFLSACKNNGLPAYSFIEPRYANGMDPLNDAFFSANDQHPDHNVEQGEILIRDTFNAIWNNPAVRNSTLMVIAYDLHGGLFDHVPPPATVNPDGKNWAGSPNSLDPAFDFTRLGVRVPAVIISPYIAAGTIDHTQYDHSSIIATACKLLLKNVPNASLTNRDRNANTFEANLTLAQPRTEAIPISLRALPGQSLFAKGQAHFYATNLNIDINDHLAAHVEMASHLEKIVLPSSQQSGVNPDDIRSEKQASDFLTSVQSKLLSQAKHQSDAPTDATKAAETTTANPPARVQTPDLYPTPKIVSDRWSSEDTLGYEAYARTIAALIAHKDTNPPLTIGIKAAWGVGKTSLMKRVQRLLDADAEMTEENRAPAMNRSEVTATVTLGDVLKLTGQPPARNTIEPKASASGKDYGIPPRMTVWFNAWKYQTSEQIWAGLAHCIITQVTARMGTRDRELFWLKLHTRRISQEAIRRRVYTIVLQSILPLMLVALFACVTIISILTALPYFGFFSRWLLVGKIAAPLLWLGLSAWKARNKLGEKAASTFKEIVREPDYEGRAGFLYLVESDIRDVLDLVATKDSPLVIFIDDLDRCVPRRVAEVVEAINLSLSGDYPNCVFVLGMEPAMVAAALEVANKDVIEKLTHFSLESSPSPLGWRFMEKIIQLPITIPPPTDLGVAYYMNSLTSSEAMPSLAARPQEIKVRQYQQAFQAAKNLTDVDQLTEEFIAEASGEDRLAIAEASNQRYIEKFADRDPAVRQLVELAMTRIGRNPRQIKRYINAFRFYAALRRVLKNEARASGTKREFPTDVQLAKFIALTVQWPHALDSIRASRGRFTQGVHAEKNESLLATLEKDSRTIKDQPQNQVSDWQEYLRTQGLPTDGWLASREFREFLASEPPLAGLEGCGLW